MAGSTFGKNIRVTTWGESHGKALGCVVDGFPAGLEISESDIQKYLDRRKPGASEITTARKEDDLVEILSGIYEGRTTGTPISLMIKNASHNSHDYSEIKDFYRPGHADFTYDQKYGFRDYRGGGRSSGRETAARVAAGSICLKLLSIMGIEVCAFTKSIGDVEVDPKDIDMKKRLTTPTAMPSDSANEKAMALIAKCKENKDSVGGVVECRIKGVPAGIGDPVFDKLDAILSMAVMSIGAVKAVEIGDGCKVATRYGSENNDSFETVGTNISKKTNRCGGILGGISDGSDIVVRAYIKPTPSIARTQETINKNGDNIEVIVKGRHDPVIVPRAVVVVESMCAIALLDMMISNMSSKVDNIISFYKN